MSDIRLQLAREQVIFARDYTQTMIQDIPEEDWFRVPLAFPTHIAWQIGHVAMAEYGLTLLRIRGREPDDEQLIPKDFLRRFKKGSTPSPQAGDYPSASAIRATLDAVHAAALEAMAGYQETELEEPLPAPTAVYANKLGSLFMCSAHEMLHAGQIGVLRRALGHDPIR